MRAHVARDGSAASADALTSYLVEVGTHPLLTAEEERMLAARARAGDAAAAERLTKSNLRLVIAIARRYQGLGLGLADLIQEGNQGLLKAVEKFDPERGVRFSTYATWWIRQSMIRGANNTARLIRVPTYLRARAHALERTARAHLEEHGRAPTAHELAAPLSLTPEQVRRTQSSAQPPLSIDAPAGSDRTVVDLLSAAGPADPESYTERAAMRAQLERCVAALPPREALVIRLRFGLLKAPPLTLDEVGRVIGVTRERVRQLEAQALVRLRRSAGVRGLELYLGG